MFENLSKYSHSILDFPSQLLCSRQVDYLKSTYPIKLERSFRNLILCVLNTSPKPIKVLGELFTLGIEAYELDSCIFNLQIAILILCVIFSYLGIC